MSGRIVKRILSTALAGGLILSVVLVDVKVAFAATADGDVIEIPEVEDAVLEGEELETEDHIELDDADALKADNAGVTGDPSTVVSVKKVSATERTLCVAKKGTLGEALAELPKTWEVTFEDGRIGNVSITWECLDDFDNDDYSSFVFKGTIDDKAVSAVTDKDADSVLMMEIDFQDIATSYVWDGNKTAGLSGSEGATSDTPVFMCGELSPHSLVLEVEKEQGTGFDQSGEPVGALQISNSAYQTLSKITPGTSSYCYSKLSADEKTLYNNIDKEISNLLYYGKSPTKYEGKTTTALIPLKGTESVATDLFYLCENPQAFMLNTFGRRFKNEKTGQIYIYFILYPDTDTAAKIKSKAEEIAKNLKTVSDKVKGVTGDYNKAKKIEDLVCARLKYDTAAFNRRDNESEKEFSNMKSGNYYYERSLMSVFADSRLASNNMGYAAAYAALARLSGLKVVGSTGKTRFDPSYDYCHCKVSVNGKWYNVCPGMDDSTGVTIGDKYFFFLKSDATEKNRCANLEPFWVFGLPECKEDYKIPKDTEYKITYKLNGGKHNKNSRKNPTRYTAGSGTIVLKAPSRKGYKFKGWYSGSKKITKINKNSKKNYTLTAKWTPNKYKIIFNKNGGKGSMKSLTKRKYGRKYKLPANKFTRKGYKFTGWSTKKKGKVKYKNKANVKNLTSKNNGKVTLYAQWKKKKKK